jgi:pimeloyl-ACP methyl ester carboxylesterase
LAGHRLQLTPSCLSPIDPKVLAFMSDPPEPKGRAARAEAIRSLIERCLAGPDAALLLHMDSASAARDMDRIRAALGEEQLNYLGFSYGARLGATYASLFPQRVRAFVLDGGVAWFPSLEASLGASTLAFEAELDRFFESCGTNPDCAFRKEFPARTKESFDALLTKIATTESMPAVTRRTSIEEAWKAIYGDLVSHDWKSLDDELTLAAAGDDSALLRMAQAGDEGIDLGANWVIHCLDEPFSPGFSLANFDRLALDLSRQAPRTTRPLVEDMLFCASWPAHAGARRPAAPTAPPLLVLSSRFDAATPLEQAKQLVHDLGNGSHLVEYLGEGHGVLQRSACARATADQFFEDPKIAPVATTCPVDPH